MRKNKADPGPASEIGAAIMTLIIGNVTLSSPVILAPMSGVTDLPFRRLVRQWGVGLVVSEMIASQAMIRANQKTLRIATIGADEKPAAVQLAGNEPEVMAAAAQINVRSGADLIDINMGCPVKKVVKGEAGAALMREEKLAAKILRAVVAAVDVPVTLKMRTGWDDANRNAPHLARIAEQEGVQAITVHGRTRSQFYKGHSDWDFIGEVKSQVSIPVIGNGDVLSVDDAQELIRRSGVDGVMVGRGVYGRPWFPNQVARFLTSGERLPDPPLDVQLATLLAHFRAILDHYGEAAGIRIARKHISWYSSGLKGSARFRSRINASKDATEVIEIICRFYDPLIEREPA